MDKATVTTLAKAHGARLIMADRTFGAYQFPNDEKADEFRHKIPFLTLLTHNNILNVYFDKLN